ncbi:MULTISPECIES: lipopolysaccharide 3-alpha-galactosyltransferase [unclassified Brenneria]|uniref:lipopolysaccharide 3-alpha-galactosyltransferase n=2 Tax=unclassified Brenneria TaxID=2634434 RepID=UPI0029C1ED83|nr:MULTISPECIES: lipopolysaccharide 3-alpha-galactosyltransferase [unclassified Brenneria]MDX5629726.1 lipopolysaccharide 3-alpha-galactosyltransferase [Brenneria sp. L3-3Z]MDX5696872.1 lipopolysaccharide 3-alpha-galactosyltransferase [Brenneria sp. L4-2C]
MIMYFNKNDVITETIEFSFSAEPESKPALNISFGTDKNFLFGCAISIASILMNNPSQQLAFHVFTDTLENDEREKFRELAQQYNTTITFYIVNCGWLKQLPSTKNWSYAIYFRFIITDYFSNTLDKIVYLDSDITCNGSLQELIDLDISHHIIAAVAEGSHNWWAKCAQRLATPTIEKGYFNSGFLLINLKKWHEFNVTQKTMSLLTDNKTKGKISYPDQDILNILLPGHILFLDKKYNTQFSINYELKCKPGQTYPHPINDSTVFIHYIGPTKPWHAWADYPSTRFFQQAKQHSPWKDMPLQEPQDANQLRYCAKHMFHRKKRISAIYFYWCYFLKKIK